MNSIVAKINKQYLQTSVVKNTYSIVQNIIETMSHSFTYLFKVIQCIWTMLTHLCY